MKRTIVFLLIAGAPLFFSPFLTGCGDETKSTTEKLLGGWTKEKSYSFVYLQLKPEGNWQASVKIADVTTKIVDVKGKASGKWYVEQGSLVMTVVETDTRQVFEKNKTTVYDIVSLTGDKMVLTGPHGRKETWKAIAPRKEKALEKSYERIIRLKPFAVNLNKNRSHDKDRYLCLNVTLRLKEIMADRERPKMHPKAREAVILYLSSFVYKNVSDLDKVEGLQGKLKEILNPYLDGLVDKVEIDHVVVASTMETVEKFLIEHSLTERISKKGDKERKEE